MAGSSAGANAPALAFLARSDSELRSRISQEKTSLVNGRPWVFFRLTSEAPQGLPPERKRYNQSLLMPQRYGVVAYVTNPIGNFVEALRRELRPVSPRAVAHLNHSPPRLLRAAKRRPLAALRQVCQNNAPFFRRAGLRWLRFSRARPRCLWALGRGPIGWAPCIRL